MPPARVDGLRAHLRPLLRRKTIMPMLVAAGLLAAACSSGSGAAPDPGAISSDSERVQATVEQAAEDQSVQPPDEPAAAQGTEPAARRPFLPEDATTTPSGREIIRTEFRPRVEEEFTLWKTNWLIRTIDVRELVSGGIPRDGIESIDRPKFETIAAVAALYGDATPLIQVEVNGDVRGYPLQILSWHEVVNDVVGGVPLLVTFCPLCNSAIAFERTVDGEIFEFGVSGALRNSDLVMYDRTTESLWQQIGGDAIVGDMVGAVLQPVSAPVISFKQFRALHPEGLILSQDTGTVRERDYSVSAYRGYDAVDGEAAFAVANADDRRLEPKERVVAVRVDDEPLAYPFSVLSQQRVVNDEHNGQALVVFWTPGLVSVLDDIDVLASNDIGSTAVFLAELDGQSLRFQPNPRDLDQATFIDDATQSVWNLGGEAVDGPLAGSQLTALVHADHFWFAWVAFEPSTLIITEGRAE